MNLLRTFYKTKNLASNGKFILLSCFFLLLLVGYFIPEIKLRKTNQIYLINGFNAKYNDAPEMSQFFKSIKDNNGVLCLGTSESGSLEGGNYYNFLNTDPEITDQQFSILVGAGRTCGIHIPLFLQHKKDLDSLKLIYFINPVYWGGNLCEVSLPYWERYSNYGMIKSYSYSKTEEELFLPPVKDYFNKLNVFKKGVFWTESKLRKHRRGYFHDLYYNIYPGEYLEQFSYVSNHKRDLNNDSINYGLDLNKIDTKYNIDKSFTHKDWFSQVNEENDYRYKELKAFIAMCKYLNIQATYILGPINRKFIVNYASSDLAAYQNVINNVRGILEEEKVDYIDATDLNSTLGAFNDHQHHSSYGAYLIYKKIKNHLYAK